MSADIKQLFEAGAHFGHKTSRWNPKMNKFIFTKKDGIHIINLETTVEQLNKASEFVQEVAGRGRQILFVGTQKQSKEVVKAAAESVNMPYVTERWMGGMLTNQQTIVSQIKKLKLLEKRMASGELASRYNKLEVQRYQEEIDTQVSRTVSLIEPTLVAVFSVLVGFILLSVMLPLMGIMSSIG